MSTLCARGATYYALGKNGVGRFLMKVLMITPSYYPIKGGAESVVSSLTLKLNGIGVKTDIMTYNMDEKWRPHWKEKVERYEWNMIYKVPGLNLLPIAHSNRNTLGINLIPGRFQNRLKKYDIIHFHGEDLSFPLFSYSIRKPKVFQSHGLAFDFYRRYSMSRSILTRIADLYLAITRKIQREFAMLGIPESKIRYLPNAIDTVRYRACGEKDSDLILYVGRITQQKGIHVLLKSLKHLPRRVRLVIIGPSDWDGSFYQDFIRVVNEENSLGLHKISYLGPMRKEDIVEWYQKASIVINPSFSEAASLTLMEALSCETPVIGTRVGGVPEIVHHGMNGILVPPNNDVELAKAIQLLLDNEDTRRQFGRKGRQIMLDEFSYDRVIDKLCTIYNEIGG